MIYKIKFTKINSRNFFNQVLFLANFGILITFFSFTLLFAFIYFISIDNSFFIPGYISISKNNKKLFFKDGVIDNILIKNGDLVQKGQPIFSTHSIKVKVDLENLLYNIKQYIISDFRLLNSLKLILCYEHPSLSINFHNIQYYYLRNSNIIQLSNFNKILSYFFKHSVNNYFEHYVSEIKQVNCQIKLLKVRIINFNKKFIAASKDYKLFRIFIYKKVFDYESLSNIYLEIVKYNNYFIDEHMKVNFYIYKIQSIKINKKSFFNDQNILLFDKYKNNYILLSSLETQFYKLKNLYYNTLILSPVTGKIDNINMDFNYYSQDNIPALEIIPQNDFLFAEAFINSNDINDIFLGGVVRITINNSKLKLSPRILGKVIYISPDENKQFAANSGNNLYYKIKIAIPNTELSKVNLGLYPGMNITLFFIRGKSNIFNFLSLPIQNVFLKSFS